MVIEIKWINYEWAYHLGSMGNTKHEYDHDKEKLYHDKEKPLENIFIFEILNLA